MQCGSMKRNHSSKSRLRLRLPLPLYSYVAATHRWIAGAFYGHMDYLAKVNHGNNKAGRQADQGGSGG